MSSELDPVVARILSFRRPDESGRAFADRIGESHQNLQNWKKGHGPTRETIQRLCRHNLWSAAYVLVGIQPRYQGSDQPDAYAEGVRVVIRKVLDVLGDMDRLAGDMDRLAGDDRLRGAHEQLDPDRTADP